MKITTSKNLFPEVSKKERKKVEKLFNGLRLDAAKALLKGGDIPNFDLCSITVPGANLFCEGNKGIPRSAMPQLKGFPTPGTPSDSMPKDKSGKVDISQSWLDMLKEEGIATKRYKISPAKLKASQNQLVGVKIAVRTAELQNNPEHKKFTMPYFISKDGYILDGHHGWASVLAYCLLEKKSVTINVIEVDMKIKKLIALANKFMREQGIAIKLG
jgi:hypothetical protein